jgi:hypothetical protein
MEDTIRVGEKNSKTMELVRNWCEHVTVQRVGGVGLIEQMYQIPIGHFGLQCPHAPAGGIAAFDLVESALDFYDRNCIGCSFRKPVGVPNLSQLVGERDRRLEDQRKQEARGAQAGAERQTGREAARQHIRKTLDPVAVTTLDLISAVDQPTGSDKGDQLVEAARLAPETFTPAMQDHLFELAELGGTVGEAALSAVALVARDKARLLNAALRALANFGPTRAASEIVETTDAQGDRSLVIDALPALAQLAAPSHEPFFRDRDPVEGPLVNLYRRQPDEVQAGLAAMLQNRDAWRLRIVVRAISLLQNVDPVLINFMTDDLMARLARSKWLIEGRSTEVEHTLSDIRRTLLPAFHADPAAMDNLLRAYLPGITSEGFTQLHRLYRDVLHRDVGLNQLIEPTEARRLAFRRLVVAATEIANNDQLKDARLDMMHGRSDELTSIVIGEIDLLLGSAAILLQRSDELDREPLDPRDPLAGMTRWSKRSQINHQASAFVGWACAAAGRSGPDAIGKILDFLAGLPEDSDALRATVIGNFSEFCNTTEGLKACLPAFYTGLIGTSQLVRSRAAKALGEMPRAVRENMPSLVFEAFLALLDDPYRIVHMAAARALERFSLPGDLKHAAFLSLAGLINVYVGDRHDDGFLVALIELVSNRFALEAQLTGRFGDRLLEILSIIPAEKIMMEAHGALPALASNPHWIELWLRLLGDKETSEHNIEQLLSQIDRVPLEIIHQHHGRLAELAVDVAEFHPGFLGEFVERLTASRGWSEASRMARRVQEALPDDTQHRSRRLRLALVRIACEFEVAAAAGDRERLESLAEEWKRTLVEIEEINEEIRRRDDASGSIFRAH